MNKFREPFTGYEYHNIGVPLNTAVKMLNGVTEDEGLLNNPAVTNHAEKGKFKVPTLRNVAVTEPYMPNGVFMDLQTVIEFYDHMNSNSTNHPLNRETGAPWESPEVPGTVANDLLDVGDPMTNDQVEALVCFLRTLTDRRCQYPIQQKGIDCN